MLDRVVETGQRLSVSSARVQVGRSVLVVSGSEVEGLGVERVWACCGEASWAAAEIGHLWDRGKRNGCPGKGARRVTRCGDIAGSEMTGFPIHGNISKCWPRAEA